MKRTNESGRSMVEMLGVLAIIGVLSVGGIAGYTMAMNRYRSNEIIDMANKLAVVAFSARETYAAMHNGVVDGNFTAPTLASSGLYTGSTINGATFTAIDYYSTTDCAEGTDLTDDGTATSTTALGVGITINFGGNENVCKAAASTLGKDFGDTCTTIEFCSRSS